MITAVADTHTAVWYLFNNPQLSAAARQAIEKALQDGNQIGVSSISLTELVYLAEKGRIPATAVKDLIQSLFDPEYPLHELPVDASIAAQMSPVGRDGTPLQSICDQQGPENPSVTFRRSGKELGTSSPW
jgi:PIN domain nuclease of toxin-antitoxin system